MKPERNLFGKISILRAFASSLLFAVALFTATASTVVAQDDDDAPQDAIALFNEAQEVHEKGDLPRAILLYDKAIAIVAEFPEAEYQKGDALLALGKTDEAEKSFRLAISHRPDWSLALARLGEILVRKHNAAVSSSDPNAAKDFSAEATQTLRQAIEIDLKNFPAYAALVDLQLHSSASIESLKETLEKIRSLTDGKMKVPASIWTARAAIEDRIGLRDAARSSLKNVLSVDTKNIFAIKLAAGLALADDDTEQASAFADSLAKLEPDNAETKLLLARVLAAEGKGDEAIKQLDLIKEKLVEADALRERIAATISTNTVELENLLSKDQTNATYLGRLCNLNRLTAPEKALEYCRRAADAEPNNINHAIGFAAALVQAKRLEQATAILRKILVIAPDNYTVHVNLATALFGAKRYTEAKVEYQWIASKQPDRPIVYYLLGITHDQLGEHLDAMANYQQFLRSADATKNQLEIEKVNLRIPTLDKVIKSERGKKQ